MIDHEAASRELVRHLRGPRSQRALSGWLQYTTNVVYLWEAGRRWPTAAGFLWLAHRTGVDVEAALATFLPGFSSEEAAPWTPKGAAHLLVALQGDTPAVALAARIGVSRDALGRWLRGQSEPRLPDLLRLVDAASTRLLDWIALFADPVALPSTAQAWTRLQAARALTREQPWSPVVLLALELADYQALPRHEDEWLARRLGLAPELVAECLALLAAAGQVRRVGRRWRRVEVQSVDTREPGRPLDLKRWWAAVALERLGTAEGTVSFNICTVSAADFERLQALQRQHYRELRALIAASDPGERVVLLQLQTLALDRPH